MKSLLLVTAVIFSAIGSAQAGYDCSKGIKVYAQKPPMLQLGDHMLGFSLSKKVNKEIQAIAADVAADAGLELSNETDAFSVVLYVNPKSGYVGIPMGSRSSGQQQYQEIGIMAGSYQESVEEGLNYIINKCSK